MKASVIEKLVGYAKRMENREDIFTIASPHMLPKTETFYKKYFTSGKGFRFTASKLSQTKNFSEGFKSAKPIRPEWV